MSERSEKTNQFFSRMRELYEEDLSGEYTFIDEDKWTVVEDRVGPKGCDCLCVSRSGEHQLKPRDPLALRISARKMALESMRGRAA